MRRDKVHEILSYLVGFGLALVLVACDAKRGDQLATEARNALPNLRPLVIPNYGMILSRDVTHEELVLGRMLFNDPILSRNNDTSCATCHLTNHGFADGNSLAVGSLGQGGPSGMTVGRFFGQGELSENRNLGHDAFGSEALRPMFRNSLSTVNVVYRMKQGRGQSGLFHDGRFGSLRFQTLLPIHTPEELCGTNPVPLSDEQANLFRAGGPIFTQPVTVSHSHGWDKVSGANTGEIHYIKQTIAGIPVKRQDDSLSVPSRNECTALMVAKIRLIPVYRRLFKMVYKTDLIEDHHIARALETFLMTHTAHRTPYDAFARGRNSALSERQLRGMMIFHKKAGERFKFGGRDHTGAGCASCHAPPLFGGTKFAALGVISDVRSELARPQVGPPSHHGFVQVKRTGSRKAPQCHSDLVTAGGGVYGPDIGQAGGSFSRDDCYKFRVSPLRNVVETAPYFHHGTAKAQGQTFATFRQRARAALEQAIKYHLRGPVDTRFAGRRDFAKRFFDPLRQRDPLIPFYALDFSGEMPVNHEPFPIKLSTAEFDALVDFVANGLWDREAMQTGSLGNDVSHPREVPSGFSPSITRDHGHQGELPPAASPQ